MESDASLNVRIGDNYTLVKEIGRGSFATVYLAYATGSRKPLAVKSVALAKLNKKLLESLESEIAIQKKIKHPHIASFLDCLKTPQHIHIVMEYYSLGDLGQLIKKKAYTAKRQDGADELVRIPGIWGGLEEPLVRHLLLQLASALQILRDHHVIHRDLKPQNLLLRLPTSFSNEPSVEYPSLHLADFGFARFLPSQSMASTLCGSPLYMAPEILRYEKYDEKVDLWSAGAVLFEMIYGKPPFRATNHLELLKKIEKSVTKGVRFPDEVSGRRQLIGGEEKVSDDLKELIAGLLKVDVHERMSYEEFLLHRSLKAPGRERARSQPIRGSPQEEEKGISHSYAPRPSVDTPLREQGIAAARRREEGFHPHTLPTIFEYGGGALGQQRRERGRMAPVANYMDQKEAFDRLGMQQQQPREGEVGTGLAASGAFARKPSLSRGGSEKRLVEEQKKVEEASPKMERTEDEEDFVVVEKTPSLVVPSGRLHVISNLVRFVRKQ